MLSFLHVRSLRHFSPSVGKEACLTKSGKFCGMTVEMLSTKSLDWAMCLRLGNCHHCCNKLKMWHSLWSTPNPLLSCEFI